RPAALRKAEQLIEFCEGCNPIRAERASMTSSIALPAPIRASRITFWNRRRSARIAAARFSKRLLWSLCSNTARSFLLIRNLWWFMDLPPLPRNELLDRRIELGWFKWLRHCQCQAESSYLLPFLRCCAATDHHNRSVLEGYENAD